MNRLDSRRFLAQRGTSVLGLFLIAVLLGFAALVVARTFPSVNEYLTIRKAVTQIMRTNPTTAAEIRTAFQKQREIEYSISTITEKDLEITQFNNALRASFAYQVEIPLVEPVFLLIKYQGSAVSSKARSAGA